MDSDDVKGGFLLKAWDDLFQRWHYLVRLRLDAETNSADWDSEPQHAGGAVVFATQAEAFAALSLIGLHAKGDEFMFALETVHA